MTVAVHVRAAAQRDSAAIAGIFAPYVTDTVISFRDTPPAAETWSDRIVASAEQGLPFLVAVHEGVVIGFAAVSPWRSHAGYRYTVEHAVYVKPGMTGSGIGSELMTALLDACRRTGLRHLIAVIAVGEDVGAASVRFHMRFGFRAVGTLTGVGHKHGRTLDTVLMQLDLEAQGR